LNLRKHTVPGGGTRWIEHYFADRIAPEHYSLIKFTRARSRTRGKMWDDFTDRQWLPMEKSELERLLGVEVN
jgi:hypothetical protein